MTAPIKQAPLQRPSPTASVAPTTKSAGAPNLATPSKGTEVHRNRPTELRSASDSIKSLDADSMLFMQMLVPPPPHQDDQSSAGKGSSSFSMFAPPDGVPTQLIDELAMQLPQHGNRPFTATFLMPNLGKVQIRAQKRDSHWDIELGLDRTDVLERLSKHHGACQQALAQTLKHDVELRLQPAGQA